jgi:16S rRNA C967 or C1407 C5-methylase (RsmB/RsmF family)
MSNSPVQISDDQRVKAEEFISLLVEAVLGVKLSDIAPEKQAEVKKKCADLFSDYIINYIKEKYGAKDAARLMAARESGEDVFSRFEDLGGKFEEGYQAFLDDLEKIWTEGGPKTPVADA